MVSRNPWPVYVRWFRLNLGSSDLGVPVLPFMVPANIPQNSERWKHFFSRRRAARCGDLVARLVPAW